MPELQTHRYRVPAMHCGKCEQAVRDEVSQVAGVEAVDIDLDSKLVIVRGREISDQAVRGAIDDAGYEVV